MLTILLSWTAIIGGLLLITIILRRSNSISNNLFVSFLFTLTTYSFFVFLFESKTLSSIAILYSTCTVFSYLVAPSMYLYVVSLLSPGRRLTWKALINLLPIVLLLVDYFPLLMSNNGGSNQLNTPSNQYGLYRDLLAAGGTLPAGSHYLARHILAFCYIILAARALIPVNRSSATTNLSRQQLNWLRMLVGIFLVFTIAGTIAYFFAGSVIANAMIVWEPMLILATVGIASIFYPHALESAPPTQYILPAENGKRIVVPDAMYDQVHQKLQVFILRREFLRKQLKLREVAEELEVQPYILSAYINKAYKMRFNDLINRHRIEYIKDEMMNNKWKTHTLEAMAKNAGFSNRTTFLISFKKFTGLTPTAFLHFSDKDVVDET